MNALRIRGLSAVWVLCIAIPAAATDAREWDQTKVTALAAQLQQGVNGLRSEIRSVDTHVMSTQSLALFRLRDNLRVIEGETRHLHTELENGMGRDETLHAFERILRLRRDCAEEMRRLSMAQKTLDRIDGARVVVREMSPYYGLDPDDSDHAKVLERRGP